MEENIEKMIEAAIQAPSGENCQPWKFEIVNNKINIFNVPERDQSLYNFDQRGSLVAHGAAIKNIIISASELGYKTNIDIFPNKSDANLIATVSLIKSMPVREPLYEYIFKRTTNRKPYQATVLTEDQKKYIFGIETFASDIKIKFTDDLKKIDDLSNTINLNEQIIFENKHLHDFFFDHIRWTDEESESIRNGFYIKTLELKPPQIKAMNLFKNWRILNLFNRVLGVSKKIAADNAKTYKSSAVMGVIIIPKSDAINFVKAGMLFEQIWLRVTKLGLSLQPVTGVLFLMQKILSGRTQEFTTVQINLIKDAYQKIKNIFDVTEGDIALLFRIGEGGTPSARSPRMVQSEFLQSSKIL